MTTRLEAENARWFDDPSAVANERKVYAVVRNERTAGELRALLLGVTAGLELLSVALDHDEFVLLHRFDWERFRDSIDDLDEEKL